MGSPLHWLDSCWRSQLQSREANQAMQPPVTRQSAVCVGPTGIGGGRHSRYREVWRKRRGHRGLVWPLDKLGRSSEVRCHCEDEGSVSPVAVATKHSFQQSLSHHVCTCCQLWIMSGWIQAKNKQQKKPNLHNIQGIGHQLFMSKNRFLQVPSSNTCICAFDMM